MTDCFMCKLNKLIVVGMNKSLVLLSFTVIKTLCLPKVSFPGITKKHGPFQIDGHCTFFSVTWVSGTLAFPKVLCVN